MVISTAFYDIAKSIVPAPIRVFFRDLKASRRLYDAYFRSRVQAILPTLRATSEYSNFTYELSERSHIYLVETLSCALGRPRAEIEGYIREAMDDKEINPLALATTPKVNLRCPFGRRLGWYAVARAIKPKVIVETGVERGHGSLILCAALLRNSAEGSPGRYFGTDFNPKAGALLTGKYASVGQILYGDSIQSLKSFSGPIDLFINDSDHSADYEAREYETVADKLSPSAIILGDNAHATDKLARFSRARGRNFLFFKEEPKNHWYVGAGLGISFPP